jgi:hypothetical protein
LAHKKSANDRVAKRLANFRASACTKRQRDTPKQCGHRRHENSPEAEQARPSNGDFRVHLEIALGSNSKVPSMMPFFFTIPIKKAVLGRRSEGM